ncbi:MAG: hypothetical protein KME31_21220 [Tolypothrix carrinoi HA7290-LM1]|jgi:AraC-like DNA-binding protein|nr:hypothetical protein [Tolypothrix carrinoi HA7290-LM1]
MQKAQQLLLEPNMTVAGVAAVGYASPTFNAAFRKKFGVNPKAYQLAALRK